MTLSNAIKAQEEVPITKWLSDHKYILNLPKTRPAKKTQNITFGFARGSDSWCIGYQRLYFHEMTLSKDIRAQEGVPTAHNGFLTTKMTRIGQKHAMSKSPPH